MVIQSYEAEADNEYVIRGNSAVMKCEIPSFVADFVAVDLWFDSDGNEYYPGDDSSLGSPFSRFSKIPTFLDSLILVHKISSFCYRFF